MTSVQPISPEPPNLLQKTLLWISNKLDAIWSLLIQLTGSLFKIQIGKYTKVRRGAVLSTKYGGRISIGKYCEIQPKAMLLTYGGNIQVGNHCSFNPHTIVYGHGNVIIGNGVRIAAHSVIIPANHDISLPADSIYRKPLIKKGVVIENNVWIGTHCIILDGVRIAEGCVIAAGAVVTHSTKSNGIYAGVPARWIKSRSEIPA